MQLYEKETSTQVFSCEYREIFKNTYFEKHLRMAAWNVRKQRFIHFLTIHDSLQTLSKLLLFITKKIMLAENWNFVQMLIFIGFLNYFIVFIYHDYLFDVLLFSNKLSNRLSIKTTNMHKIFNELKCVFILQYFYSDDLNSRKFFQDVLFFRQITLSINLVIILVHVRKYLGEWTKHYYYIGENFSTNS